jgi:UPF0755 protein
LSRGDRSRPGRERTAEERERDRQERARRRALRAGDVDAADPPQPAHEDAIQERPTHEEATPEEVTPEGPAHEPVADEQAADQQAADQQAADEHAADEHAADEQAIDELSLARGGPAVHHAPMEGETPPVTQEPVPALPAPIDAAWQQPAVAPEEPMSPGQSPEPPTVEPPTVEPATDGPAVYEPPTHEPETVEPATVEPAVHEPVALEQPPPVPVPVPVAAQPPPIPPPPGPPPSRGPERSQAASPHRRGPRSPLARLAAVVALVAVVAAVLLLLHSLRSKHVAPVAAPVVVKVLISEGKTRPQIAQIAAAAGLKGSYRAASKRSPLLNPVHYGAPRGTPDLEGFLFPATYDMDPGAPVSRLVQEQLIAFRENFGASELARARALHITPYQLLIVASMVEREAQIPGDRPKIAAVIYNRLREGMPLGIDAAIYYAVEMETGIATYTHELSEAQLHINSPYNTRTHVGLPPTPISNPGLASIGAAAHPAHVSYLYYVAGADGCGEQVFSDTLAEFEAADAAYKAAVAKNGGHPPTCKRK